MVQLLTSLFVLVSIVYGYVKYKRAIHMLQQNSYRNERYDRWIANNKSKVYRSLDLTLFALPLLFVMESFRAIGTIAAIGLIALLVLTTKKEVEKKALVVTPRVKRLIFTTIILTSLPLIVAYFVSFSNEIGTIVLSALVALFITLAFPVVKLANTLNRPMETKINNGFIQDASNKIHAMRNLKVIGITGSYGKTSVKNVVGTILSSKYHTHITPESFNTPMGVTITTRRDLQPIHDVFVVEMGAKQLGDIKEICDIVHQKYAIVTAVGPQHLETFGSLENVQKTKFEIVEALPEDGIAFLNWDDENIRAYPFSFKGKIVKYGINGPDLDFRAENATYDERGATFTFASKDGQRVEVQTKLLGEHNIMNIVAGMSVGATFGIPLEQMASAVRKLKPVKHRLELLKRDNGVTIIDNSFNSNPEGSKMSLQVLSRMPGKKILVTPGMIELGEKEYELNKAFGAHAAKVCDYIVFVGQKQTKPLQEGALDSGFPQEKLYVAKDLFDGMNHLNGIIEPGSYILLENDLPDSFNE